MTSDDTWGDPIKLGAYELVEQIGSGGMGAVWRARRADGLMEREVAIKLIAIGMRTMAMRERFARERQILATLNHPNIARLYEAGVTDTGQPYLVLEYVDGEPIDQYCDSRRLSVRERVQLFLQVLAAVSHAHQHLVVHRDLKPGNILVTKDGTVKLLDFGISKLLQDHRTAEDAAYAHVTRDIGRILTPEYAAPEQISGNSVTTATDVYAAGVLLYELLAGVRPYRVRDKEPATLVKAILENEPVAASASVHVPTRSFTRIFVPTAQLRAANDPSAQASTGELPLETRAQQRATTPVRLRQALAGDLDNILSKALKKDPYERYETAGEFADDLRAYLESRPVKAQPDSVGYRAAKFVRRNRGAVATAALSLFAILAGIAATTWQAIEARKHAEIARKEAAKANAIRDYMVGMFRAVGRDAKEFPKRGDTTARELIDYASQRLNVEFTDQPEVKAFMRSTLSGLYFDLDHTPRALSEAQSWFADSHSRLGAEDTNTIDALIQIGTVLGRMGRTSEAEEAFANAERRLGARVASEQGVRLKLAQALLRSAEYKTREAQAIVDQTRAQIVRFPTLQSEFDYVDGQVAFQTGKYRYGLAKLQSALDKFSARDGKMGVRAAETLWRIGLVHLYRNDWLAAEDTFTRALEVLRARSPSGHRDTLVVRRDLAFAKLRIGKLEEAFKISDSILEDARKRAAVDQNKAFLAGALQTWGRIRLGAGDADAAMRAFSEADQLVREGQNDRFFSAVTTFDLVQARALRGEDALVRDQAVKVIEAYQAQTGVINNNLAVAYILMADAVKRVDPVLAKKWLALGRSFDWSEAAFPANLIRAHFIASQIAEAEGDAEMAQRELSAARALLERHRTNPESDFRLAQADVAAARIQLSRGVAAPGFCARVPEAVRTIARFTVPQSPVLRQAKDVAKACAESA